MAFVKQHFSMVHAFMVRRTLTPQERANLRVSRPPVALITASLGGHPHL